MAWHRAVMGKSKLRLDLTIVSAAKITVPTHKKSCMNLILNSSNTKLYNAVSSYKLLAGI